MIFNMVGGGGVGGASIFIVNSVNERPTNVFNNTLWVNTGVDVVKYVFSDNEPSNPTEGMLWLVISNSDNVNVAAPINKDWMKFNLGIIRQYIGGAWERKFAQLYKDGIWVDVSRIFSATISITYPANSTCTVTNSSGQIVANDTNTGSSTKTWTAIVNASGTYTVTATATDGSGKSKSQSVSITTEGQFENVELSYGLVLYESGNEYTELTGGWEIYRGTGAALSPNMLVYPTNGSGVTINTKNKIDVSKYGKLCFEFTYTTGTNSPKGLEVGLAESRVATEQQTFVASVNCGTSTVTNKTIKTLDISKIDGEYLVMARSFYSGDGIIYKIWLEE